MYRNPNDHFWSLSQFWTTWTGSQNNDLLTQPQTFCIVARWYCSDKTSTSRRSKSFHLKDFQASGGNDATSMAEKWCPVLSCAAKTHAAKSSGFQCGPVFLHRPMESCLSGKKWEEDLYHADSTCSSLTHCICLENRLPPNLLLSHHFPHQHRLSELSTFSDKPWSQFRDHWFGKHVMYAHPKPTQHKL